VAGCDATFGSERHGTSPRTRPSAGKPWKIQSQDWSKRNEVCFGWDTEDIEAVGANVGGTYEVLREEDEA